jgi:hypothetical protein
MQFVESKFKGAWRGRGRTIEKVADSSDDQRSSEMIELDLDDPAQYRAAADLCAEAPKPWDFRR